MFLGRYLLTAFSLSSILMCTWEQNKLKKSSPKNLSAVCRPTIGRQWTNRRPTSRSTNGQQSADKRSTVGGQFSKIELLTDGRSTVGELGGYHLAIWWQMSAHVFVTLKLHRGAGLVCENCRLQSCTLAGLKRGKRCFEMISKLSKSSNRLGIVFRAFHNNVSLVCRQVSLLCKVTVCICRIPRYFLTVKRIRWLFTDWFCMIVSKHIQSILKGITINHCLPVW